MAFMVPAPIGPPNRAIDHWAIAASDVVDKGNVTKDAWETNDSGMVVQLVVDLTLDAAQSTALSISPDGGTTSWRMALAEASVNPGVSTVLPPGWSYQIATGATISATDAHKWLPIIGA